jgi:hypothetical protein
MTTDRQITAEGLDITPRYVPDTMLLFSRVTGNPVRTAVTGSVFHPAGTAPKECAIRIDCNALEVRTAHGSRWYGCQKAYINSELRMVVVGFPAGFEEMAAWKVCKRI